MNGVTSSLMREKGVDYKLNFGVSIPRLRVMAALYSPDAPLAEDLWSEDVRELKILATLIYPPEKFTKADDWVKDIANLELAEQAAMNLFSRMPDARRFASRWIAGKTLYINISGFLLYTRLLMQGMVFDEIEKQDFLNISLLAFQENSILLNRVVLNTLQHFITRFPEHKTQILLILSDYNFQNQILKDQLVEILN